MNLAVKSVEPVIIRSIEEEDNASIAGVLRASVEEHDAPKVSTFYDDPHTDTMFQTFNIRDAEYWAVAVFTQLKVYQKDTLNCRNSILDRNLEGKELESVYFN